MEIFKKRMKIIILLLLVVGCKNSNVESNSKELNQENHSQINPTPPKKKYIFISTIVSKPVFHGKDLYVNSQTENNPYFEIEQGAITSSIIEVQNLTEDEKYRMIDVFESNVIKDLNSDYENAVKANFLDTKSTEHFLQIKATIDTSIFKEFDTYKDASLLLKKLRKI